MATWGRKILKILAIPQFKCTASNKWIINTRRGFLPPHYICKDSTISTATCSEWILQDSTQSLSRRWITITCSVEGAGVWVRSNLTKNNNLYRIHFRGKNSQIMKWERRKQNLNPLLNWNWKMDISNNPLKRLFNVSPLMTSRRYSLLRGVRLIMKTHVCSKWLHRFPL